MANDLSVVQQHLRQILADAPGGRVPLARLGVQLREVLPDFSAAVYGFPTLKSLLEHAAVPGKLEQTGPLEWWLVADSADPPGPGAPVGQERTPLPGRVRVQPAWWRAVTAFDEDRHAWFDLQEGQLSLDAELAAAEPERFLAVPLFGLQAQRELARAWSEERASPMREDFLAALAEPKLTGFMRAVEQAGLVPKWNARRREVISSALLQWANDHGIDPRTFLDVNRASPINRSPASAPLPRSSGMSLDELRQFLHRVIEDMTEPELMQVPVPARFLLRR